jgi:hypothetical protein
MSEAVKQFAALAEKPRSGGIGRANSEALHLSPQRQPQGTLWDVGTLC